MEFNDPRIVAIVAYGGVRRGRDQRRCRGGGAVVREGHLLAAMDRNDPNCAPSMLEAGVVDEITLLVCPASRGKGTRIFEDRPPTPRRPGHVRVLMPSSAMVSTRSRWASSAMFAPLTPLIR
jgi:hypothetical protein